MQNSFNQCVAKDEPMAAKHYLVEYAESMLLQTEQEPLSINKEENCFLSPTGEYPHAFVLACLMDRQVKAEIAWKIPIKIRDERSSFAMEELLKVSVDEWKAIFKRISGHRFPENMADIFFKGLQLIERKYNRDASRIWKCSPRPSSGTVICRFLEFEGCGIKIATMATNILYRQFKVEFEDKCCLDASPDVLVRRVLRRNGLIVTDKPEELLYATRALNPKYPGIIDLPCWKIGREYCLAEYEKCNCTDCPLDRHCPKINYE